MGFSKTWVAVRGGDRDDVLAALDLRGTGEFEELAESPFDGARLPSGWFLVEGECGDVRLLDAARLSRLSAVTDVVTLSIEEHVMVSHAAGWRDGRERWSVLHESERGVDHLAVTGTPPDEFEAIRDRQRAEQATGDSDVDYVFDVPVDLAHALTGYRHDQDIEGAGDAPFEVLEPATKPSFWKRLTGG